MDVARQVEQTAERVMGGPPEPREGSVTRQIERYTAAIPSGVYLSVALGAMGLSLLTQAAGRGKWGNFIGQWVPTVLILGLYNKLVKVEGHDEGEPSRTRGWSG